MRPLASALVLVVVGLAVPLAFQGSPTPRRVTALVGGTLVDGYGGPPLRNSVILIEGERISAVGQVNSLSLPEGADVLSTEGMTVMPGLWDMHVHTMIVGHADYDHWDKTYASQFASVIMPAAAKQLLSAGVTSARDLGGPLEASIAVRNAINEGRIPGATLYVAGPFIQHEPYPNTENYRWGVKGPQDATAKVKKIADAGVDVVKLIDQDLMSMDEVRAVVDEAHRHGKPVVAHAHRPEEIRRGLAAGVDCFEHTGLATAPAYPDDIIDAIRERTAKMALGPLYWTPTIEGLLNYEYLRDNPEALDDPAWHEGLPEAIVADIRRSLEHPDRLPYFQLTAARRPTLARKFKQLQEAGVTLLVGTDSGIPMNFHTHSTWRELDAWVNVLGVDPITALRAASYWPSVAMKVDRDVGTVTPGKYADIIAVRGDAIRYIALLQRVDVVIKHGTRYK
jgi:imidazolonepropionase-like amidohydrolase